MTIVEITVNYDFQYRFVNKCYNNVYNISIDMVLPNNLSLTFIFLSTVVSKLILMCIQIAPKLIVTCFQKFNLLSMNIVRRLWQGSWFLSLIKEAPKRAASTPSNLNRVGMQKRCRLKCSFLRATLHTWFHKLKIYCMPSTVLFYCFTIHLFK